jgi:YfiH family protein
VINNRQIVLNTLGIADYPAISVWQVHSADVAVFHNDGTWRTDWGRESYYFRGWRPEMIRKADAIITRERGVALVLSFADCTPLLFYDPIEQVIAIAHGGWRGTARGVVMSTLDAMQAHFGSQPEHIRVGLAPSIGACCYEVSEDVHELFLGTREFEERPTAKHYRERARESARFTSVALADGRMSLRLDVAESNRQQLLFSGVRTEHIEEMEICTSCYKDDFFSYRGHRGKTGRFPVAIALRG